MGKRRPDLRAIIGLACAAGLLAAALLIEPFVISEDVPFVGDIRFVPLNPGLVLSSVIGFFSIQRLVRSGKATESGSA